MVMKGAVRVSLTVWVRERQVGGRTGEVMMIKATRGRLEV